jgi:hypothetical protein
MAVPRWSRTAVCTVALFLTDALATSSSLATTNGTFTIQSLSLSTTSSSSTTSSNGVADYVLAGLGLTSTGATTSNLITASSSSTTIISSSTSSRAAGVGDYIMAGLGASSTTETNTMMTTPSLSYLSNVANSTSRPDTASTSIQTSPVDLAKISNATLGNTQSSAPTQTSSLLHSSFSSTSIQTTISPFSNVTLSVSAFLNSTSNLNPVFNTSRQTLTLYGVAYTGPSYPSDCIAAYGIWYNASTAWSPGYSALNSIITVSTSSESAWLTTNSHTWTNQVTSNYTSDGIVYGSLSTTTSTDIFTWTAGGFARTITSYPNLEEYPFPPPCTPTDQGSSCASLRSSISVNWTILQQWPRALPGPTETISGAYGCTLGCYGCEIQGNSVEVLYWPVKTKSGFPNVTITPSHNEIVTAVRDGRTFTSPTVYVSYDTIYANGNCGRTGNTYAHGIITIPTTETLSTWAYYAYHGAGGREQNPFNYADLNEPVPLSIYQMMPSCDRIGINNPNVMCPVPIPGNYNPLMLIPKAVFDLDPLWTNCATIHGNNLFDPPQALQSAGELLPQTTPKSATPVTTPADPGPATPITTAANPGPTQTHGNGDPTSITPVVPIATLPTPDPADTDQPQSTSGPQFFEVPVATSANVDPSPTVPGASPAEPSPFTVSGTIYSVSTDASGGASLVMIPAPSPNSPQIPPITLAGTTLAVTSGALVFAGQTATAGGPAIIVSGTPVQILPSNLGVVVGGSTSPSNPGVVVGGTTLQASPVTPPKPAVIVLGGTTYSPDSANAFTVAGQTLAPGQAIVVDGTTVSLEPSASAIIVNGVTISKAASPNPSAVPELVIGGTTYHATNGMTFTIDGAVLTPGGTISIHGTQVTLAASAPFVVVNGVTSSLAMEPVPTAPVLTIDGTTIKALTGLSYSIDGQLLTPGGTVTTHINGSLVTISLGSSAASLVFAEGSSTLTSSIPRSGVKSSQSATPGSTGSSTSVSKTSSGSNTTSISKSTSATSTSNTDFADVSASGIGFTASSKKSGAMPVRVPLAWYYAVMLGVTISVQISVGRS